MRNQAQRAQAMKINTKTTLWDGDTFIIVVVLYSKEDRAVVGSDSKHMYKRVCLGRCVCVFMT